LHYKAPPIKSISSEIQLKQWKRIKCIRQVALFASALKVWSRQTRRATQAAQAAEQWIVKNEV
jgi:hypothetical protein